MFVVSLSYPVGPHWEDVDRTVLYAAGRVASYSGVTSARSGVDVVRSIREYHWYVDSFPDAVGLRRRLAAVAGVRVTLRER